MSMRATADRLRAGAEEVRTVAALLGARLQTMSYAGPAADRFRLAQGQRRSQLVGAAERMDALGSRLVAAAARLELDLFEQARRATWAEGN